MNVEEFKDLINKIKSEKLRDYLVMCLEHECQLNPNLPISLIKETEKLIDKASQRFENKIKICQQIEKDFPEELILPGENYFFSKKLDTLRLCLARLYANEMHEITEKDEFKEIKTITIKILDTKNLQLKLKVFDLTLKVLEKTIESLNLNKDFIAVLDLIKFLVNDPHALKIEHLQNINNLPEKDIKKDFYGIVYALNLKLIFQDLLNQLSKINGSCNNSLLMQFNLKFISNCIEDQTMVAEDLNQLITLVFQSLKNYDLAPKSEVFSDIRNIFNQKKLNDYLVEFENECKERTPQIKLEWEKFLYNQPTDKSQESVISIYFPVLIRNEKLRIKFFEAESQILEKNKKNKSKCHSLPNIWQKVRGLNFYPSDLKTSVLELATSAIEVAGTSTERIKDFITKKKEDYYKEEKGENEKIAENDDLDLKNSLINSKTELFAIKEKLDAWKSKLNYLTEQSDTRSDTRIDIISIDLNQNPESIMNVLRSYVDEKFSESIDRTLGKFRNIIVMIKRNGYWLAKLEINKPSFAKKLLQRGYFNIDFSIKKIKAKLGNAPSFNEITDFIAKQSFWALLFTFGIVRWPWMDKTAFAHSWAEQLCLPEMIDEIEKIKTLDSEEKILEKIIILSKSFFINKNQEIVQILEDFKSAIIIISEKLEVINQKIEEKLSENNFVGPINFSTNGLFSKTSSNQKIDLTSDPTISLTTHS
ncbi:MAG: hypothetical protein RLY40_409 [Pseudomonadota bacterium]|jgi:hypothetical protein